MQLSGAYPDLSDTDLDALYAATYASFKNSTGQIKVTWSNALMQQGMEITDRLMNVKDFITGLFGHVRFPQFDAIQKADPTLSGFQQSTEAQTVTVASASNVGATIKDTVTKISIGGIGLGIAAVAIMLFIRKK